MTSILEILKKQREFQKAVNIPIDSVLEDDRNKMSDTYLWLMTKEITELSREFPSISNPWTKHNKSADITRIKEELSDVILFIVNFCLVWKFTPEEILETIQSVQSNNFNKIKEKKMAMMNSDILKIPNKISGVGYGNLSPKWIFVGHKPSASFPAEIEGVNDILIPILEDLGIQKESCYFTNLVKCAVSNTPEPTKELLDFYLEFYVNELEILTLNNPDVNIIAMGDWTNHNIPFSDSVIMHPIEVFYGKDLQHYKDTTKKNLKHLL